MHKYFGIHLRPIPILAAALLMVSCAQQGYPSGGPKDTQPPVVKSATPPSGTTQFCKNQFYISFDEYVQVKDASNNILVSPPMKHTPEYTPKGKGLVVKINDTLMENTTYLFQFQGALADFNEGNVLPTYNYVFSTGSSIDSMTVCGKVTEAFTAKPHKEDVTLLAYPEVEWNDSTAVLRQPLYMTRCDKKGFFQFCNMRAGSYRILALEDVDRNLKLGAEEAVAFLDGPVTAQHMPVVDTTRPAPVLDTVVMSLSAPKHEKQRIAKSEMLGRGRAQIVTHLPMSNPAITTPSEAFAYYLTASRDTLNIWTLRPDCDSLRLVISDSGYLNDTLSLRYTERKTKSPLAGRKKSSFPKSLPSGKKDYFDSLWIRFDNPAALADSAQPDSLVLVTNLSDSSTHRCGIAWDDTKLNACICFAGQPGGKYQFRIAARQFTDIWKQSNDSLDFTVELTTAEEYGGIKVDVACEDFPAAVIVQLIDEKGTTLAQQTLEQNGEAAFPHLKPGKYSFRAILDSDGDGEWTPGDFWEHRHPEKVVYFSKTLDLRNNWDIEEHWSF